MDLQDRESLRLYMFYRFLEENYEIERCDSYTSWGFGPDRYSAIVRGSIERNRSTDQGLTRLPYLTHTSFASLTLMLRLVFEANTGTGAQGFAGLTPKEWDELLLFKPKEEQK